MSCFKAKMHQVRFRLKLHPRPRWGDSQRSPDILVGFKGRGERTRGKGKGEGRRERTIGCTFFSSLHWPITLSFLAQNLGYLLHKSFSSVRTDSTMTITVSSEINRLFSCFGSVIALIWPRIF